MAIPLPQAPGMAFGQGMDAGSTIMNRILHNRMQQQNLDQTQQRHLDDLALRQAQDARMQEMHPLTLQGMQNQLQMHPLNMQALQNQLSMFPTQRALQEASAQYKLAQANKMNTMMDPNRFSDYVTSIQQKFGSEDGQSMNDFLRNNPIALAAMEYGFGRSVPSLHQTEAQRESQQVFGDLTHPDAKQFILDKLGRVGQSVPGAWNPKTAENIANQLYPEQSQNFIDPNSPISSSSVASNLSNSQYQRVAKVFNQLNNSIPMGRMSQTEQKERTTEMVGRLNEINEAKNVNLKINKLRDLMEEWPNLYRSVSGVIFDPERPANKEGYLLAVGDRLLKMGLPQEEYAAAVQMDKLYADILNSSIKSQSTSGGGRMTNMGREIVNRTKGQFKNPDEANRAILNNLESHNNRVVDTEDALKYSLQNGLYLPPSYDYDNFQPESNIPKNPVKERERKLKELGVDTSKFSLVQDKTGKIYKVPNNLVEKTLKDNPDAKRYKGDLSNIKRKS